MRVVRVADLQEYIGCSVARNVYIGDGKLYLRNGSKLTDKIVEILQEKEDLLPFEYLYLHTDDTEDICLEDEVISDELKFKTKKHIKDLFNTINPNNTRNLTEALTVMVEDLFDNKSVIQGINTLLFAKKDDVAAHCLNTAIIASIVAIKMGLPQEIVENIASGAALHDVGKAKMPPEIFSSKDPKKILLAQDHPILGYQLVDKSNLSLIARRIILMHHVWEDYGASYDPETRVHMSFPNRLNNNEVTGRFKDLYIGIVQAADVFDTLCSDGVSKAKALEYIRDMQYLQFGPGAKALLDNISPYSIGQEIKLSNGMSAIVVGHTEIPDRPVITFAKGPLKGVVLDLTDKNYLTYQVEEL